MPILTFTPGLVWDESGQKVHGHLDQGEPRKSYPWTALGYTYDWGAEDFRGESEFVLPANTPVVIESITSTDVYCAPVAARSEK